MNGLEAMVRDMEALHNRDHQDHAYDEMNCIYGATDIVSRYTMISGPSDQILEGLAGNTAAGEGRGPGAVHDGHGSDGGAVLRP